MQDLKEKVLNKVVSFMLLLPVVIIGFSQMYWPKWQADDWFYWFAMFLALVSLNYWFPDTVEKAKEMLLTLLNRKEKK